MLLKSSHDLVPLLVLIFFFKCISADKPSSSPIQVGIVTCILDTKEESDFINAEIISETLIQIKSIVISASLYKVPSIKFHAFVDNRYLKYFLERKFSEHRASFPNVKIDWEIYYVFDNFPYMSHFRDFILTNKCQYVRLFFPHILPKLDKILYLDSDMIVTGNIQKVWDYFGKMSNEQICAIAPNNELEDKNFGIVDKVCFEDIPHVPPKGVNTGVMLMDLDKMREFGFSEKILELYNKYWNKLEEVNDQKLTNILFHNYPGHLKLLPCQFNFMHVHCDQGLTCSKALQDPLGLQMIHGAASCSARPETSLYHLFQSYLQFNTTGRVVTDQNIVNELMVPVKVYYTYFSSSRTCFKGIGSVLFKQLDASNLD